jgi:Arc/MetJ family transcription regulator
MATTRVTITLDAELLAELKSRVGPRQMSSYVVDAVRARLRKDPILELLDKLDEMYGPLTAEQIAEGEQWWTEANERLSASLGPSSDSSEPTAGW